MGSFTSKGLDVGKQDIIDALGKPPPEGMVPIGDWGIYVSPHVKEDKPVSPFDCEAWPNSPYCGGQPWTTTPVGAELEFTADKCGVSITGTPILAWTKMPDISVGWIAPNCRKEYDAKRNTPTPLPEPPDLGDLPQPESIPGGFEKDDIVVVVMAAQRLEKGTDLKPVYSESGNIIRYEKASYSTYLSSQLLEIEHPTNRRISRGGTDTYSAKAWAKMRLKGVGGWADEAGEDFYDFELATLVAVPRPEVQNHWMMSPIPPLTAQHYLAFDYQTWEIPTSAVWDGGFLLTGRFGSIFPGDTLAQGSSSTTYNENVSESVFVKYEVLYIALLDGRAKKAPPNFDDYDKKRDCCMNCCTGGQAQERRRDEDLSEILKHLKDIKKVIGFEDFPVKVPQSLITKDEGFIGNLIPNPPASEPNIPRLIGRFIRYFDEVLGQWEIPIEIKDADPLTPGEQPKGVKLHNVAECLADLYAMTFDSYLLNQQLLHLGSKNLIETGMAKQNVVQNYYALLTLIDFFGYKYREIDADVPLSFKAGEEEFEKFIKDSEQRIKVLDLDVNDKNVVTYKDDMLALKQAAQIIKAVYFRKLDHKGDMKQQVIDLVKFASQYVGKVEKGEIDPSGNNTDAFEDWLEDAETEFSRKTGVNTQNPYGRPYEQRPRLTIMDVDNPTDAE